MFTYRNIFSAVTMIVSVARLVIEFIKYHNEHK